MSNDSSLVSENSESFSDFFSDESGMSVSEEESVQLITSVLNSPEQTEPVKTQEDTSPSIRSSVLPRRKKNYKIPVFNKYTLNPDTYDIDYLLDPRTQKASIGGHRFAGSYKPQKSKSKADFIQKNINNLKGFKIPITGKIKLEETPVPTPKASPNMHLRLYAYSQKVTEKIEKLRKKQAEQEMQACPFSPQVLSKGTKRKPLEYYKQMIDYLHSKQQKIKAMQEEQAQEALNESYSFKPELCEESVKIVSNKHNQEAAYERLYKLKASPQKPTTDQNPKKPVKENNSVHENLFKSPIGKVKSAPEDPKPQKLISKNSMKLLLKNFLKELKEVLSPFPECLNYTQLKQVLFQMHFLKNQEEHLLAMSLFKELQKKETVESKDLKHFFLALMQFSGHLYTEEQANKIFFRYKQFHDNRCEAFDKSTINKTYKFDYSYQFAPSLDSNNFYSKLADRRKSIPGTTGTSKIEDHLINSQYKRNQKLEKIKHKLDLEQQKICTHKPNTSKLSPKRRYSPGSYSLYRGYLQLSCLSLDKNEALYNLHAAAKNYREELKQLKIQEEEQETQKSCTFKPSVLEYTPKEVPFKVTIQKKVSAEADPEVPSQVPLQVIVEKSLQVPLQAPLEVFEESFATSPEPKEEEEPLETASETPVKDFEKLTIKEEQSSDSPKTDSKPGITLNVKTGFNKSEKLEIKKDQDIESTVLEFAKKHQIPRKEAQMIIDNLRNNF